MTRFGPAGKNAQLAVLALLPIAALLGNAIADISLVLLILVYFTTNKDAFKELSHSQFFKLSLIFWIWILVCSAVSLFPRNSFQDSLPWIRFPLFAFGLSFLASKDKISKLVFLSSSVIGTLIQCGAMSREFMVKRLSDEILIGASARLTGTYQKLMPGWYMVCFGLISSMYILYLLRNNEIPPKLKKFAYLFLTVSAIGMVITGEVINTIVYFSSLFLFALMNKNIISRKSIFDLMIIVAFVIILLLLSYFDRGLNTRIIHALDNKVPWSETSDYFSPLKAGYEFAAQYPLFGVGPKNLFSVCNYLKDQGAIDIIKLFRLEACPWHPHNLYIQIAAESGLIGLTIFCLLAIYLIQKSLRIFWISNKNNSISFALIFIALFPLQTYSQAFGQFRNFFLWTVIGFSLSVARQQLVEIKDNGNINSKHLSL